MAWFKFKLADPVLDAADWLPSLLTSTVSVENNVLYVPGGRAGHLAGPRAPIAGAVINRLGTRRALRN